MDGHSRFFLFRNTRTRRKHFFAIKNNDSETFIKCFEFVIDYYESKGYKVKILRSDYFSTFVAADLKKFYNKRNIVHQASSPHRHHQNAVERDIQTLIGYVRVIKGRCMGTCSSTLGAAQQRFAHHLPWNIPQCSH